MASKFEGCCGAVCWYLGGSDSVGGAKERMRSQLEYSSSCSIALVILTTTQRKRLEKLLAGMGFVECWGPIKNQNSNTNLYGYVLNLTEYREKTMKSLIKRRFSY